MSLRLAGGIVALLMVAGPAAAGVLRGHLDVSRSAMPPGKAAKANPSLKDAVVYIERVPQAVENQLTRRWWFVPKSKIARMRQSNLSFSPRVLAVVAGTSVVFENLDKVYHNTFSVSASKRFDLGRYPPDNRDTLTFEKVGAMNLHCDLHSKEVGFMVVVPNHAFARPDSYGRFTLPKLAPGTYVLRVWHPRRGEKRQEIEMPARGDLAVEVKL